MTEVSITYCLPCRYQFKAIQDADAILQELGERLTALRLVPGADGVYDVAVDGEVIYSLDRESQFPEAGDLVTKIRSRLDSAA